MPFVTNVTLLLLTTITIEVVGFTFNNFLCILKHVIFMSLCTEVHIIMYYNYVCTHRNLYYVLFVHCLQVITKKPYSMIVLYSRDHKRVGVAHKIISPIKQPQFPLTTMRQYWLSKTKPKKAFRSTRNVFNKLLRDFKNNLFKGIFY